MQSPVLEFKQKQDYSDLWKLLLKGTLIPRWKLEKIIGFKEIEDPKQFQFEVLRMQKAIELYSRLNGQALFVRQDAGAIKIMKDDEASTYKAEQQYKLIKRIDKLQRDKDLIDRKNLSLEQKKAHEASIAKFDRYLSSIRFAAKQLGDERIR